VWRRPGGSGLAKTDQGLQTYLSLPSSCFGEANLKHGNKAHLKVWVSVRMKWMPRENGFGHGKRHLTRAIESTPGDGKVQRM
jgi:hypothetical protein